jgi:hypothetical protein
MGVDNITAASLLQRPLDRGAAAALHFSTLTLARGSALEVP